MRHLVSRVYVTVLAVSVLALLAVEPRLFAQSMPGSQAASPATNGGVLKGLPTRDWASIRAAYEANRHAAFAVEGGYQARNPGQQWLTRFDGRGFTVQPDAGQ